MKLIVIPRPESHTPTNLDPPEVILQSALELALPATPVRRPLPPSTRFRSFTRRGTMFVGKKCNLRCHFCCYLDRVEDSSHPEHDFLSLEKTKALCKTLVDVFGRNAVDIQGGEPTIYPHILPLIEYCNEIGLRPTLITNALVLDRKERVLEFKKAGVNDFLISVQGLGAVYDTVVGMEGAHVRQMKAIRHIAEAEIPFRFNTVTTKAVVLHLPQIAALGVRTGARVVNYLMYSPQDDQVTAGTRTVNNVPRYAEMRGPLVEALDILAEASVEANVRFFPYCMVPERHRKSLYNYAQIQYDHHDWDFASTAWTDSGPQLVTHGDISEPDLQVEPLSELRTQLRLGRLRGLRQLLPQSERVDGMLDGLEQGLIAGARTLRLRAALEVSDAEEKAKAMEYAAAAREVSYTYSPKCQGCDAKAICDGLHSDSAQMFGMDEVEPIQLGFKATDPTFYIRRQDKLVEPGDESWAFSPPKVCLKTAVPSTNGVNGVHCETVTAADVGNVVKPVVTWPMGTALKTSVIIPTYRRPRALQRALRSLQEQTLADFEIVVVDNAIDPETEQVVTEFNRTARRPARYLSHSLGGNRGARHRAVREAQGDLLMFTDDDATFAPRWLEAFSHAYTANPTLAAAAGPIEPVWEEPPPQWLLDYVYANDGSGCSERQMLLSVMPRRMTFECDKQVVFFSVNMSIRREALYDAGGFNPEAYGNVWLGDGESGLNRKLWERGYRVEYVPEALVYHHVPPERMTLEYLRHRSRNEGACDAYADFHAGIPSRLRLAQYASLCAFQNFKCWVTAWRLHGRTDPEAIDRQLEAARSQAWMKYAARLIYTSWLRELVTRDDYMGET